MLSDGHQDGPDHKYQRGQLDSEPSTSRLHRRPRCQSTEECGSEKARGEIGRSLGLLGLGHIIDPKVPLERCSRVCGTEKRSVVPEYQSSSSWSSVSSMTRTHMPQQQSCIYASYILLAVSVDPR